MAQDQPTEPTLPMVADQLTEPMPLTPPTVPDQPTLPTLPTAQDQPTAPTQLAETSKPTLLTLPMDQDQLTEPTLLMAQDPLMVPTPPTVQDQPTVLTPPMDQDPPMEPTEPTPLTELDQLTPPTTPMDPDQPMEPTAAPMELDQMALKETPQDHQSFQVEDTTHQATLKDVKVKKSHHGSTTDKSELLLRSLPPPESSDHASQLTDSNITSLPLKTAHSISTKPLETDSESSKSLPLKTDNSQLPKTTLGSLNSTGTSPEPGHQLPMAMNSSASLKLEMVVSPSLASSVVTPQSMTKVDTKFSSPSLETEPFEVMLYFCDHLI